MNKEELVSQLELLRAECVARAGDASDAIERLAEICDDLQEMARTCDKISRDIYKSEES